MATATKTFSNITFKNIDSEEFIGEWNAEQYSIAPGETVQVLPFLAKHFAKQLATKLLLRKANKFLEDNSGKDRTVLAREPSWLDIKQREPLICEMLGWTVEKLREVLEEDEKGPKAKPVEETVKKSEVQSIVDKAVAQALAAITGELPKQEAKSKEEEFPDLKSKK